MLYPNIGVEMGRHRITVSELAGLLGLSADSIVFKLDGKKEFTLAEIEGLANLFHCSLDYLVGHVPKSA